jgi:hypothetical protein
MTYDLSPFCSPVVAEMLPYLAATIKDKLKRQVRIQPADIGDLTEAFLAQHALAGPKVLEVSEGEAHIYARTTLEGVDVQHWTQSYPVIFVVLPTGKVIAVAHYDEIKSKEGMTVSPLNIGGYESGYFDHSYISMNIESAITSMWDSEQLAKGKHAKPPYTAEQARIALNAVLRLQNYPDIYTRFPSRQNSVKVKWAGRHEGKKQVLVPQTIKLINPPERQNMCENREGHLSHSVRPHWRKGHWRKVAYGVGRTERRFVLIEPVLVRKDLLEGPGDCVVVYKD